MGTLTLIAPILIPILLIVVILLIIYLAKRKPQQAMKPNKKTLVELLTAFAGSSALFGLLINSGNTYLEAFSPFFLVLALFIYLLLRMFPFFKKRRSSPYKTIVPLSFFGGALSYILAPFLVWVSIVISSWGAQGYASLSAFVVSKLPENIEKQRSCVIDNEWILEENDGLYYVDSMRACRQVEGDLFTGIYLSDSPWSFGMLLGQDIITEKKTFEAGVLVKAERASFCGDPLTEGLFESKCSDDHIRGTVRNNKLEGTWERLYKHGGVAQRVNFRNDLRHGLYETFWGGESKPNDRGVFSEGKKDGTWESYNCCKEGQSWLIRRTVYQNDKRNGLDEAFDKDGDLVSKINYQNDLQNGLFELFHKNGKTKERKQMSNDLTVGLSQRFDEEGFLVSDAHFGRGSPEFILTDYFNKEKKYTFSGCIERASNEGTNIDNCLELAIDRIEHIAAQQGLETNTQQQEYFAILKFTPAYPEEALKKGIEGHCVIEYEVSTDGKTKNLFVDQCTDDIFAAESLNTVSRFLYSPKIKDGLNLSVASVKHKLTFVLE